VTFEERVRYYIGETGPQHASKEDYESYVEDRLNNMSNAELLMFISIVLEEKDDRRY
jgi:hypothetical protein